MLIISSLILLLFIVSTLVFIFYSNTYFFQNNYFQYKQSNIVNEQNFLLWKEYIKYFNSKSWDNLFCFSWTTKTDNNCYFRWLYGFVPPETKINLWNFYISKSTKFLFSWTNSLNLEIKSIKNLNNYIFQNSWETKIFSPSYYTFKIYNPHKNWEQFFITAKNTEWIKQMPFYELTYNCNCYDSWDNLKKIDQLQICANMTWCTDTGDYIETWTIYSWKVLLKTNFNIYKDNIKTFKNLFYFSWN